MKKTFPKIDYKAPLNAQYFYHIYNRTNNKEPLFLCDNDRLLFLNKFKQFMLPYLKTYAYILLGNHFHLVIQVRRESEILSFIESIPPKERKLTQEKYITVKPDFRNTNELLTKQFSNFFTAYSNIFNTNHKRSGNLFHRPFKRVFVENESHFCNLIFYVHQNAQRHKIHPDFTQYPWSSFQSIISESPTLLEREAVLKWFGSKDHFIDFHQQKIELYDIIHLIMEDE